MRFLSKKQRIIGAFILFALLIALPIGYAEPVKGQSQSEQAQLEQELKEIETQIREYERDLKTIKGQKNTLQNKINQLKKQQAGLTLQIKATSLRVVNVEHQITDTQVAVNKNSQQTERLQKNLRELIRRINTRDGFPLMFSLLAKANVSEAVIEARAYVQLTTALHTLVTESIALKKELNEQLQTLAERQEEANKLLSIKVLAQQKLMGSVSEQNTLLQQTKGKESVYQQQLTETQKEAARIRNRLYQLLGVSTQITFGEAVKIAQWASDQTGVRTAFLLAVLTQESNLGRNVGTCNRPGDPPEKSWKVVMKPERDHKPFLAITEELGRDPNTTPVSCPMKDKSGKQMGWGGAMGPAQFIPSTWMGYKAKVTAITGKIANPWDIRDAFIAAAIKLKADGAGTKEGEWAAAMRYFSGGTNTAFRFYGDNVVATANGYEDDIAALK